MAQAVIGVFDSGSGGLTVLAALKAALPERGFLYLGDHRHQPYGERPMEEVEALTRAGVARLFAAGCRLVVLACNTAAAVALRRLQRTWLPRVAPERRILGVHIPLVEALTGHPWRPPGERVACAGVLPRTGEAVVIFATPTTVESHAFAREIARHDPGLPVIEQPCPGLARAIEAGAADAELRGLVARAFENAAAEAARRGWTITRAALACTHYPLIADVFRAVLPEPVRILDQPRLAAESLRLYLARHPECDEPPAVPEVLLHTTADGPLAAPRGFGEPGARFLPWCGEPVTDRLPSVAGVR